MPVWTRMKSGKYTVVHENCGPQQCNIHFKTSDTTTPTAPRLDSGAFDVALGISGLSPRLHPELRQRK